MVDRLDSFDFEQDTEALIPVDDKVVAFVRWRGRGRASGPQSRMKLAIVWTLQELAITKVQFHVDRSEALRAVGLSEWAIAEQRGLVEAGDTQLLRRSRRAKRGARETNRCPIGSGLWAA